jgi:hypothetical protein
MSALPSIRPSRATLAATLGLASFLHGGQASAQECKHPPACRIEELDAEGCCPKAAPPVTHHAAPAASSCTGGKETSADTDGHCCWPGQVWSRNRCVGVPTSCPSRLTVNAAGESCDLPTCLKGQNRADDGVNCCWPGQGWSRSRSICVGVPQCPKGMEIEGGDHCVPLDKDGDGIPNAVDKCPDQPEDFNGYKDDDGCPDEQERLAIVAAQEKAAAAAAAAKAAADEAAAIQRANAERAAEAARQAELARRRAIEEQQREADEAAAAAHAQWEHDRHPRAVRRTAGIVVTSVGVVSGVLAGTFAGLGGGVNSSIAAGGFASGSDIASEASKGQTYNGVAEGMLVVGLVGLAVGLPLTFASLPQTEPGPAPRVSVAPTPNGLALRF